MAFGLRDFSSTSDSKEHQHESCKYHGDVPTPDGLVVTFSTKDGQEISYLYNELDGARIMVSADPVLFTGERI